MLYHREAIQVQEALEQMERAIDAGDAAKTLRWAMLVGNVENGLSLMATVIVQDVTASRLLWHQIT